MPCTQCELCKPCNGLPSLVLVVTITYCVYKPKELCSAGCDPEISPAAQGTKMGIFSCVLTGELCEYSYFNHLKKTE